MPTNEHFWRRYSLCVHREPCKKFIKQNGWAVTQPIEPDGPVELILLNDPQEPPKKESIISW